MDDDVAGGDFKGHHGGLEDEEVPTCSEAKGLVDVPTREPDEGRRDGQIRHHLGHAHGDGQDEGAPDGEGQEQAGWSAVEETFADLDVEGGADGTSDAY